MYLLDVDNRFAGQGIFGATTAPTTGVQLESISATATSHLRLKYSGVYVTDFVTSSVGNLTITPYSGYMALAGSRPRFYVSGSNAQSNAQDYLIQALDIVPAAYLSQTAQDSETALAANDYVATKFTTTGSTVTPGSVQLKLRKDASLNASCYLLAYIYTDSAGVPGTAVAQTTYQVYAGTLTTSMANYELCLELSSALAASTSYWLVLRQINRTAGNLYVGFAASIGTSTYATSSNGTSWTTSNNTMYYALRPKSNIGVGGTSWNNYGMYGISSFGYSVAFTSSYGVAGVFWGYKGGILGNGGTYGYGGYFYTVGGTGCYVFQAGTLTDSTTNATLHVQRQVSLNSFTATGSVLSVNDTSSSTGNLVTVMQNNSTKFAVLYDGKVSVGSGSPGSYAFHVTGSSYFSAAPVFNGFTSGSVLFAGASGTLTQDNANLFWNDTSNYLGIGTTSPQGSLHVNGRIHVSELAADPAASDLTSGANAKDRLAIYMKNDKLVIAYNNSGTVTYITIALNGSATTWTHNTTAP